MRWVWKTFENFTFKFLNPHKTIKTFKTYKKQALNKTFLCFRRFQSFSTFLFELLMNLEVKTLFDATFWFERLKIPFNTDEKNIVRSQRCRSQKRSSTLARRKFSMNRKIIYEKNLKIFSLKIPRQFYLYKFSFNTFPNFSQFSRRSQLKTKFFHLTPTQRNSWTRFCIKICFLFTSWKFNMVERKSGKYLSSLCTLRSFLLAPHDALNKQQTNFCRTSQPKL